MGSRQRLFLLPALATIAIAACAAPSGDDAPPPLPKTSLAPNAGAGLDPADGAQPTDAENRATIVALDPRGAERLARIDRGSARAPLQDDGTHRILTQGRDGVVRPRITLSARTTIEDWANQLRTTPTTQNQQQITAALRNVQRRLTGGGALPAIDPKVTRPESLIAINAGFAQSIIELKEPEEPPPPPSPAPCFEAEGTGTPGDGVERCDPANLSGVGLVKNASWPAKTYCVKDQGNRGTCTAFATIGAIEGETRKFYDRKVNLSEQDLYGQAKLHWFPDPFNDGLASSSLLAKMASKKYELAYESVWPYNPSLDRYMQYAVFHDSCNWYHSFPCSDTTHQAELVCDPNCHFVKPTTFDSNLRLSGSMSFGMDDASRKMVRALLKGGFRAVLSVETTDHFVDVNGNGYVKLVGDSADDLGSHALEVVDYVAAKDLPFANNGFEGGYWVARNSWGCGYADNGYVYLSDSYLMWNGYGFAIPLVEQF